MDESDTIAVQPLAAWELAVNKPMGAIILRLHALEDPQAPLDQARPHRRVVATRAACLQLAHDLLSALRKLEGDEASPAPRQELRGSLRKERL